LLRAFANGLHRGPHVFVGVNQVPAGGEELVAFNPSAFVHTFRRSGEAVVDGVCPDQVAITRDHRVCAATLEGLLGIPETFTATVDLALKSDITFAQFVMMTPFPGTVDFAKWEKEQLVDPIHVDGVPIVRYWLIPTAIRPKMFTPHPIMSSDEIRERTQGVWDRFYTFGAIWKRSRCTPTVRARLGFIFLSKLHRQMYAGTGISTDKARRKKAKRSARWIARQCRKLFQAKPMPELNAPHGRLCPIYPCPRRQ
jgi:hypothetical protein